MKINTKWGLAFTLILFLVLSSCVKKPKQDKEEAQHGITQKPSGIISLGEAKELCDNYETRRANNILEFEIAQNPEKKFIPTQFVQFDLKTIKQYIKYVEKRARKAKIKPDSLRIYLGNYGEDGRDPNRNTVFILPTAEINGEHGGFFINKNGKAELIRKYWPKNPGNEHSIQQKSKANFFPSISLNLYQDESLIINHGEGGPPPTGDFE